MYSTKAEEASKQVTTNILDEFCEDEAYNSNVVNNHENLTNEIVIVPESQPTINRETLKEKLDGVGFNDR